MYGEVYADKFAIRTDFLRQVIKVTAFPATNFDNARRTGRKLFDDSPCKFEFLAFQIRIGEAIMQTSGVGSLMKINLELPTIVHGHFSERVMFLISRRRDAAS